ncbi:MAG TPA: condensin subunit MukF [Polyangiales bacterium]|nr:condensin subunit MukF [Polyangiales bacterium]
MLARQTELNRLLSGLAQRRAALSLEALELGFLAALYVKARQAQLASFGEAALLDVFEEVCALMEPASEQRRRRAGRALARLREQRLLVRVDGRGVVRSGEFALSRLACAIVEFLLEEDVLTRESLTLLSASLQRSVSEVFAGAQRAAAISGEAAASAWADEVVGPLRVTVGELMTGIERRQRGLDLQQEEFQSEIRRLLEADWFGAIERCQSLLEATSATLRELNELLLRDTSALLARLHDIEELAAASGAGEAETTVLHVIEQVDRIAAWGGSRQRAWSEYFLYVHRYLRDVVRLDPSRALSQRLRDQLAGKGARFSLSLAGAQPLRLLREVVQVADTPSVSRPRTSREREPVVQDASDPDDALERSVRDALSAGARSLSEVTVRVSAEVEPDERFVTAGRVAQASAALALAITERERPWVPVEGQIEIEDWQLRSRTDGGE